MSMQIPQAKISSVIKSVLTSFIPSLDVEKLKLPGESIYATGGNIKG
jgi:hypothetical protein